jgi:8-oxo-dGTP diphosphatase
VTVADVSREDHGTWAYETVLGFASEPLATHPNDESVALEWTAMRDVALRDLHPGFARSWPMLAALARGLRAPWGRLHPPDSSAEYTSSPET